MSLTKEEIKLLERHYFRYKLFGKIVYIWNTSPNKVLNHLKEISNEPNDRTKN